MTELDDALVPEVLALINDLGRDTTFEVEADSNDYNPSTSSPTVSKTSYVRKATPPFAYKKEFIDGDTVLVGDQFVMIAASGLAFTPEVGMVVVQQDGVRWNCVRVIQIDSGAQTAAYEIHVRLP